MWKFPGTPFFLDRQARRLRVTPEVVHGSKHNEEIFRLSTLLGQLCGHYERAPKDETGRAVFHLPELKRFEVTLEACEIQVDKLHLLAAAADDMLGEAWRAFGRERPGRGFEILAESDVVGPAIAEVA